jgi:hypothetical protein
VQLQKRSTPRTYQQRSNRSGARAQIKTPQQSGQAGKEKDTMVEQRKLIEVDIASIKEKLVGIYTILQAGQKRTALERIETLVEELDEVQAKDATEITGEAGLLASFRAGTK